MARIATRIESIRGKPVLVPVYRQGVDLLMEIRTRGVMQATVLKYTRSAALENWYWGLVQIVADGLGIHKDSLHADLKFKAGLIRNIIMGSTGPVVDLKSTAREAMDGVEYRDYVNTAVEIIFRSYLPGVRRADVLKQVEDMVGPRPR